MSDIRPLPSSVHDTRPVHRPTTLPPLTHGGGSEFRHRLPTNPEPLPHPAPHSRGQNWPHACASASRPRAALRVAAPAVPVNRIPPLPSQGSAVPESPIAAQPPDRPGQLRITKPALSSKCPQFLDMNQASPCHKSTTTAAISARSALCTSLTLLVAPS